VLRVTPTSVPTPSLPELFSGFSSPNVNERIYAAHWSGFYYDHPEKTRLIPYLVLALEDSAIGDDGISVRAYAAQSLGNLEIFDEKAIELLMSWLVEEDISGEELIQGIQTLGKFPNQSSDAIPGLIQQLKSPPMASPYYHQIQEASAMTLSIIGNQVAVPYLLETYINSEELSWLQRSIGIALARFGEESKCTVPHLIPYLEYPDSDTKLSAAIVIGQATDNEFPDSLRTNWDPQFLGPWQFEKNSNGEYLIVKAAKEWWKNEGQYELWPKCESNS